MNWLNLAATVVGAVQNVEKTFKNEKGSDKKNKAIIASDKALPCRANDRVIIARTKLIEATVEFENAVAEASFNSD